MNLEIFAGWYTEPGEGPVYAVAAIIPLIIVILYFIFGRKYVNKHYLIGAAFTRRIITITLVWIVLVIMSLVAGAVGAEIAFRIGRAVN